MTRAISPEMRHRGFVPASPSKGWRRGDMLRPKPANPNRGSLFLPYREALAGRLLSALIDTAHIISTTEEGAAVVSIEVDKSTLRHLFMFDTDIEDLEPEEDDDRDNDNAFDVDGMFKPITGDDEPDHDNEPDNRFSPACPCELGRSSITDGWSCSVHDKPGPDIKVLSDTDKARTPKRN